MNHVLSIAVEIIIFIGCVWRHNAIEYIIRLSALIIKKQVVIGGRGRNDWTFKWFVGKVPDAKREEDTY